METPLPALDATVVAHVARHSLDCDTADIGGWEVSPLNYDRTTPSSGGVYRVAGTATRDGQTRQWSVVLKILRSPAGMIMPNGAVIPHDLPDDPGLFGYWKREALAHEAGILGNLPGGVASAKCYGVTAPEDGILWIWQEDVAEVEGCWRLEQYCVAARCLGRFNGAYLVGYPLPDYSWLASGWLRSWLALPASGMMARIEQSRAWEHPTVWQAFPPSVAGCVRGLWEGREALLAALDRLPRVLCHHDAFRPNLFIHSGRNGADGVVAIDWAFVGRGPLGEEIAPLIAMQPAGRDEGFTPWQLDEPVFEAYLQGLDEAGWRGDPLLVRFGYVASAALRYVLPTVTELIVDLCDGRRREEVEVRRGMTFEQAVEQQVALTEFLLNLADEATSLLPALAYPVPERRTAAG